jgi:hypothetical protein
MRVAYVNYYTQVPVSSACTHTTSKNIKQKNNMNCFGHEHKTTMLST